ncbi:hypothetical protein H2198_008020 [Neophaeococcomyces mojaviensis]|uniref:Uncharacterized protein n=1 Tax=Neophaeococcomyces mojaviensis TaxID=3383035 RepID=A0ACC2ZYG9_9EURO|nr:hypothetical protein H2198_008020 [Knufia sp. JES_112]
MSCSTCIQGVVHEGEPTGATSVLHGKTCYVTPPLSSSTESVSTIVYLSDTFGLNLVNAKLLADRLVAETGCRVLVPDVIPGGPAPLALMYAGDTRKADVPAWNLLGWLRLIWAQMTIVYLGARFKLWAAPQKAYTTSILPFVRAVRVELPLDAKLGVVGFCWGGWGSTNLCKEPRAQGRPESLIDVQFCGHPYDLKTPEMIIDAVRTYNVPFSMAIGDEDEFLKVEAVRQTEAALRQQLGSGDGERGYNYEIQIYEGCTHGFVVRASRGNEVETSRAEDARAQAIRWLKMYL